MVRVGRWWVEMFRDGKIFYGLPRTCKTNLLSPLERDLFCISPLCSHDIISMCIFEVEYPPWNFQNVLSLPKFYKIVCAPLPLIQPAPSHNCWQLPYIVIKKHAGYSDTHVFFSCFFGLINHPTVLLLRRDLVYLVPLVFFYWGWLLIYHLQCSSLVVFGWSTCNP